MSNLTKELERILGQLPNSAVNQSSVQEILSILGQIQAIMDSAENTGGADSLQRLQSVLSQSNIPGAQQIQSFLSSQNINPQAASSLLQALRPLFAQFESILTSVLGSSMDKRSALRVLENLGRQNAQNAAPAADQLDDII